jgi:hypothetical protein
MEMFQHEHIRMSPKLYFSLKDLNQENHPYDVFIVGSDQVWNPRMNASMDPYFLSFVQPGKRRIAYGASFGVSNFSDEVKKVIKGQLDKFDAISMRETSGVQLVESLTGREAFPVVDPTLLLDESEWSQVSVPPSVKGDYILIYELKYSRQLTRMATQLAIKLGIKKIIRLCGDGWQSRSNEVEDVLDAGPAEFVGLFQRASFVITNSLHGTLFSIIFRKPFYYVNPQGSQNSGRISELLELTGLEDRYIEERDVAKEESILKIDYRETALRLKQMKVDSLAYLQRAIGL